MADPGSKPKLLCPDGSVDIDELVRILRESAPLQGRVLVDWLTKEDWLRAKAVGEARLAKARQRERSQPFGDPGDEKRLQLDRWSALAELVVAQYLGLPWQDAILEDLTEKPPDVGDSVEVRWTKHPGGHLITHDEDHSDRVFVLVRGMRPMWIEGWMEGAETKKGEYRGHGSARNPGDYWVSAGKLKPMGLLKREIGG